MQLDFDYATTNIWNVRGSIKGEEEPDRLVIIGSPFCLALSTLYLLATHS